MNNSSGLQTVSLVIPTFEATNSLADAINSILGQPGVSTDIIIVEDGSKKPCLGLLKEHFGDLLAESNDPDSNKIRYLQQENTGAYRARLSHLSECTGEFIKFLDQDDVLLPGTLQGEVTAFTDDIDVVLTNWQIATVDDAGTRTTRHMKAPVYSSPIDDFLTVGGCYTSAALYRRSTTASFLKPIQEFTPVKADDWLIFAQVCLSGARYKTIDLESYCWNMHGDQLSKRSNDQLVKEHFLILDWIQNSLESNHQLTDTRKKLLADYYAKQLLMALRVDAPYFQKIVQKINSLDVNYRMQHGNLVYRSLCNLLGVDLGARYYNGLTRLVP